MFTRRNRFGAVCIAFLVCAGLKGPALSSCEASDVNIDRVLVSLDVHAQPLIGILQRISESVGHEITVSDGWANVVLSIQFESVGLEEALRRIIAALGKPSHAILTDPRNGKTELLIFAAVPEWLDGSAGSRNERSTRAETSPRTETIAGSVDLRALEVIPPEAPGERGITQDELDTLVARDHVADLRDVEVIPPDEPGGRGVTQGELEEILRSQ
jgi:hypothetical protein